MPQIVPNQADLKEATRWEPGVSQRLAKAKFWEEVKNSAGLVPEAMGVDAIVEITGKEVLMRSWLQVPAFRAWFFNQHHAKIKIMAAAELAVDALVDIIKNDNPKAVNARVKAAQTILQYAGMEPPKTKEIKWADKDINEMDEGQLRQFIANKIKNVVDVEKT